jgi:hypothetical protein
LKHEKRRRRLAVRGALEFIHRQVSFGNILFDPSAKTRFYTSMMGMLRSCLLLNLFYSFWFLVP